MKLITWVCDGCNLRACQDANPFQSTLIQVTTGDTKSNAVDLCPTCIDQLHEYMNPKTWTRGNPDARV